MRPAHLLMLLAFLFLAGCDSDDSVGIPVKAGHYEGNLIRLVKGRLDKLPVKADLSDATLTQGVWVLKGLEGAEISTLEVSGLERGEPRLSIRELGNQSFSLSKKEADCSMAEGKETAQLCLAHDEIFIEVMSAQGHPLYTLTLDLFPEAHAIALESPRTFTLDEAVEHTFKMNFGTRMEFERSMQARHLAANAARNLLPHLSINSILVLANPLGVTGLLGVIGDVAPFLLPNRWIRAKTENLNSEAAQDALILMRADTAVQIQGFAYVLERDQKILERYSAALADIEHIERQIQSREVFGEFPAGTSDSLRSVISGLKQDASAMELNVAEEKIFAAQTMGFMNPKGVVDIQVGQYGVAPIQNAQSLEASKLREIALSRSFELRQMSFVVEAARRSKQASFFNWLDPAADQSTGLGFGMGESIAVERSKINETLLKRGQVAQILLQKLETTVLEYNRSLGDFALARENLALQNRRIGRMLDALAYSRDVSVFDLVTVHQDKLRVELALLNAEASYKLSRAKLDRFLLEGYFSRLSAGR